jgi:hypothetical protein
MPLDAPAAVAQGYGISLLPAGASAELEVAPIDLKVRRDIWSVISEWVSPAPAARAAFNAICELLARCDGQGVDAKAPPKRRGCRFD